MVKRMLMIAVTNTGREIIFNTNDIPLTNRSGYGVKGLLGSKLKKGEVIVDVRVDG